ncbi:unnamed protein product [Gordionus sp. m RMFG-2023]|uniref:uncharacterized protein LOC135924839 n=1 Tax=Gordionus sp. m RMFG-2023 TaxID=3053472 RepID=UPI0030E5A273
MIGNDKDLLKLIIRSNTVSLDESGFAENVLMYNTKPKIMTDIILESYPNFLEDNEDIESFRSLEINNIGKGRFSYKQICQTELLNNNCKPQQKTINLRFPETSNTDNLFPLILNNIPISTSLISQQLINYNENTLPFKKFSLLDADFNLASIDVLKHFQIFFHLQNLSNKPQHIFVTIKETALISDLIGLACWKYTILGIEPKLKYQDINHYGLFITEDDTLGNIDHDFPISEHNMPLHKFGFKSLAILESAYDS